jgi:hypothetical protein
MAPVEPVSADRLHDLFGSGSAGLGSLGAPRQLYRADHDSFSVVSVASSVTLFECPSITSCSLGKRRQASRVTLQTIRFRRWTMRNLASTLAFAGLLLLGASLAQGSPALFANPLSGKPQCTKHADCTMCKGCCGNWNAYPKKGKLPGRCRPNIHCSCLKPGPKPKGTARAHCVRKACRVVWVKRATKKRRRGAFLAPLASCRR